MKIVPVLLLAGIAVSATGQGFTNLDFEQARVVSHDSMFGFLDWSLAAPGWSHSSGNDTQRIYYGQRHFGVSQVYLLMDAQSPTWAPGTQLAGNYSFMFSSGHQTGDPATPWTQAYLSQTGLIPENTKSIRFLAKGLFQIYVGGSAVPVIPLGIEDGFAGDVSSFAGKSAELRIVNTAPPRNGTEVIIDNIEFSPLAVPEPAMGALMVLGFAWFSLRRIAR
jgi:hypothetical protein